MNSDTKNKVREILKRSEASPGFASVLQALRDVAVGIQESLGAPFVVQVEPGYRGELGQQFKLAIRLKDPVYCDYLFRTYVSPDGFPVTLDLFDGEQRACTDMEELMTQLLNFLRRDTVGQHIHSMRYLV